MIDERYRCIGMATRLEIIIKCAVDKIGPIYWVNRDEWG